MVKKPPSSKSLKETNPYLKDPIIRKKLLKQSVDSSSAVEGVHCKISDIVSTRLLMRKFKPGEITLLLAIEKKFK